MKIGHERKLTRSSVDFNLTEHCNLNCYLCDHASPLLPKKFASLEEFSRDFEALARVFHSRQLRIAGGEPLLHPQLLLFLAEARRIAIADSIVVITNGVNLHQAPGEFWDLIDELWISAYPGIHRRLSDEECAKICKEHNVLLYVNPIGEFSRTIINDRIEDPKLVKAIFRDCKNANDYSCHTVYEGRFYRCSIAPFARQRLALLGIDFDNRLTDGVELHGNNNLYEDLAACLNGRTPLAACSYCLGTSGPAMPHRQTNRAERSMWLKEDNKPDIEAARARVAQSTIVSRILQVARKTRSRLQNRTT